MDLLTPLSTAFTGDTSKCTRLKLYWPERHNYAYYEMMMMMMTVWWRVDIKFFSDLSDIIEGFKNPPGVPICRWGLSSKIGKVMTFRHLWKRVHSSLLHANHLLGLLNETDCRRDYHSFLLSKLTVTDNSKLNWIFVAFEFWWRMSRGK
jgi:hypothetical protein